MATITEFLEVLGSFLLGLAARAGLSLAAGLVLVLPALALATAWHALRRRTAPGAAPLGARLARNHTWLAPRRGGALSVGLDEIAERILPSATAVELPRPGMQVHRGDPIVVVRAGRRAVRIGAPVDGVVVRANGRVRSNPSLVKTDPYGAGWLFAIRPANGDWTALPGGERAGAWLEGERRRLARLLEDELGIAAADGGHLVAPAPALLGEDGWRKVVAAFLEAA